MSNTPKRDENSVVAVFSKHSAAENAIKQLKDSGFDIKKLAVIGRDYQSEEDVVGFYNTGERMKYWGKWGAFWGGLWGLLLGAAFLIVPASGPLLLPALLSLRSSRRWKEQWSWVVSAPWVRDYTAWAFQKTASSRTRCRSKPASSFLSRTEPPWK